MDSRVYGLNGKALVSFLLGIFTPLLTLAQTVAPAPAQISPVNTSLGAGAADTQFRTIIDQLNSRVQDLIARGGTDKSISDANSGTDKGKVFYGPRTCSSWLYVNPPDVDFSQGVTLANSFYTKLITNINDAVKNVKNMQAACLGDTPLQEFATAISQLNTQPTYSYGSSLTSICSQTGNIFDKLKQAAAAYETICGGTAAFSLMKIHKIADNVLEQRNTCQEAQDLFVNTARLKRASNNPTDQAVGLQEQQRIDDAEKYNKCVFGSSDVSAASGKNAGCFSEIQYISSVLNDAAAKAKAISSNLVTAGMSILATAMQNQQLAELCKNLTSTVDCTKTPLDPACVTGALNCNDPANGSNQKCICLLHPGLAACYSGGPGNVSAGFGTASGGDTLGSGALGAGTSGDGAVPFAAPNAAGAGGGGLGSGGGGLGGGSKSAAAAAAAKEASKSGLNPNILSGDSGGAGGGPKGKVTAATGDEALGNYGKFLPKADGKGKDLRGPAGASGEISGPNSKSNWEKVHNRYVDQKGTLFSRGP